MPADPPSLPDTDDGASARAELRDAPPFLTWPRIYVIVLGALALEIAVFAVITAAFR